MTEEALISFLRANYPQENESCEWKLFCNLTHNISSHKGEDVISYVSAIANMEGGQLILGVKDQTLEIEGIQCFHNYTAQNLPHRLWVKNLPHRVWVKNLHRSTWCKNLHHNP